MNSKDITLYDVIDGTWPAAQITDIGPWQIRTGSGGGSRVSATSARRVVTPDELPIAESAMRDLGQPMLFMIRAGDDALDAMLETRGYKIKDPVTMYRAPVSAIATVQPPPVTAFTVWEPLAIQIDIWAKGGISQARVDVMHRAKGPKTSLVGRLNDHPAAAGFVAIHAGVAMVHALEILPHQRRQNMGVYAMRRAAFWAQSQGADHIACVCTTENTGANALYASLGMEVVGQYHYRILEKDALL